MNEQNAADKDLLTIEELAAHAMECEKEETDASVPFEVVGLDAISAEESDVDADGTPDGDTGAEQEENEGTTDNDAPRANNAGRKKTAKGSGEETEDKESFTQQLRNFVDDEEVKPFKIGPIFKALIGGDGLSRIIARNWVFIIVIVFFSCCYVTSRYMMQNATLERNKLNRTLADRKYKALTASSEYLEKTRSHYIESNLKDTTIHSSTDMPYALKIEQENSNE